jgi:Zn finger protein HypA/HybF involved in hydrogenase expression
MAERHGMSTVASVRSAERLSADSRNLNTQAKAQKKWRVSETILSTYCEVCKENGVKDDGYQHFEMKLVNVDESHDFEQSTHTYEGVCPECGTSYLLICERTTVDWKFCKKESDVRFCNRCGCKADRETELDYPWYCPNCDENLYNVETDAADELDLAWILYGLYLHDWVNTHDEGEPVCFNEFLDNEYLDVDWMVSLMVKYALGHMIDEYRTRVQESE